MGKGQKIVLWYLEILSCKGAVWIQWSLPSSYATSLGHHLSQPHSDESSILQILPFIIYFVHANSCIKPPHPRAQRIPCSQVLNWNWPKAMETCIAEVLIHTCYACGVLFITNLFLIRLSKAYLHAAHYYLSLWIPPTQIPSQTSWLISI